MEHIPMEGAHCSLLRGMSFQPHSIAAQPTNALYLARDKTLSTNYPNSELSSVSPSYNWPLVMATCSVNCEWLSSVTFNLLLSIRKQNSFIAELKAACFPVKLSTEKITLGESLYLKVSQSHYYDSSGVRK